MEGWVTMKYTDEIFGGIAFEGNVEALIPGFLHLMFNCSAPMQLKYQSLYHILKFTAIYRRHPKYICQYECKLQCIVCFKYAIVSYSINKSVVCLRYLWSVKLNADYIVRIVLHYQRKSGIRKHCIYICGKIYIFATSGKLLRIKASA